MAECTPTALLDAAKCYLCLQDPEAVIIFLLCQLGAANPDLIEEQEGGPGIYTGGFPFFLTGLTVGQQYRIVWGTNEASVGCGFADGSPDSVLNPGAGEQSVVYPKADHTLVFAKSLALPDSPPVTAKVYAL